MKKILTVFLLFLALTNTSYAEDKYSQEYLKNHNHFSIMNPIAESIAEHSIKSALKKETGANFDVKFEGYTLSSMKKGIFKYLELTANNVKSEDVVIPYVHLETLSDYNYVDYTKDPVVFKSDMKFAYNILLSDESMNQALKHGSYSKVLDKINNIAYPLFQVKGVRTKIITNRVYVLVDYNFPIAPASKNRVFVTSTDFKVENGKIIACGVKLDSAYGNISLDKVANMINLLNPLGFTLDVLNSNKCNGNIESLDIVDNKIKINGKIFIKGE